jgi:hypothetical protein
MSEQSLLKFSRERPPLGLLQTEERQKPSGSICKHVRTVKKIKGSTDIDKFPTEKDEH